MMENHLEHIEELRNERDFAGEIIMKDCNENLNELMVLELFNAKNFLKGKRIDLWEKVIKCGDLKPKNLEV